MSHTIRSWAKGTAGLWGACVPAWPLSLQRVWDPTSPSYSNGKTAPRGKQHRAEVTSRKYDIDRECVGVSADVGVNRQLSAAFRTDSCVI